MSDPARSVLLFDLGGVLIENQMFSELKRLMNTELTEASLIELWLKNPVAREFELGRCTPDVFARSIIQQFHLPIDHEQFLLAFKSWPKGFYPGVESLLMELKTKATIACLSNSNEIHWTNAITDHFEFAYSSHEIGCIKPDRDAFDYVLESIGARAGEVHFFDDAALNVDAALSLGLMAHHTIGFEQLKTKLVDLGFAT